MVFPGDYQDEDSQRLWEHKVDWDDPVPPSVVTVEI